MATDETVCILHDVPSWDCAHLKHDEVHSCGYVEDTFACKIRHLHLNTGDAKANKSPTDGSRWSRAADLHHKHFD